MGKGIVFIILLLVAIFFINCKPNKSSFEKHNQEILDSLKTECGKLLNSPQLLEAATALEKEAIRQSNDKFIGFSSGYKLKYYRIFSSNIDNVTDSVRLYGEKAKSYFIKANYKKGALRVEADLLRWEIQHEHIDGTFTRIFDLIQESEALGYKDNLIDVYSILGSAHMMVHNPSEALIVFRKELDLIRSFKLNNEMKTLTSEYIAVFAELANAAILNKDFEDAVAYSDSIRYYMNRYSDDIAYSNFKILPDVLTVEAKIGKKNLDDIAPYVNKLINYCDTIRKENRQSIYYNAQSSLAEYYFLKKGYTKAIYSINEVLNYYNTNSNHDINMNGSKDIKADILAAMGQKDEALALKSDMLDYYDSVIRKNASRQISEIHALYQLSTLEKQVVENNAKARYFQIISIFLVCICILMIAIAIVVRVNYIKLRRKNEKIFKQYKDLDKYRKEISTLNSSITANDSDTSANELTIYEKIEKYINEAQCYKDPEITREYLALQIGTNREYLTRAIQENVNMTFTEYINYHRLEYARILLVENVSLSIENVYMSAGFTNKSTFYRLFKQKYDLTPKELRYLAVGDPQ